jgi:hypothetical protein
MARIINAIKKLITAAPEDENSLQRPICQLESENEELRETCLPPPLDVLKGARDEEAEIDQSCGGLRKDPAVEVLLHEGFLVQRDR